MQQRGVVKERIKEKRERKRERERERERGRRRSKSANFPRKELISPEITKGRKKSVISQCKTPVHMGTLGEK